ncbi:MAG: dolichol-P-glucose synthetase [Candidatus Rokuibacteriota bacterium]|nr:MAG: dolichol-P-glucose synthetase [Candidatus Rokubacteria bacterium]
MQDEHVEVSIVIPCLNEADTLATCIRKAGDALERAGVSGEIVVADNGSSDGSQQIAECLGARVVNVAARGYGNALMAGIAAARGRYVIMGDADDSYDFGEAPKFIEKLRQGFDLVQGCRLPAGGGRVMPGAMPWLHRVIGNPMLTFLVRKWFGARIHDVYCGMRGFTKSFYQSLRQHCTGMEFATEMIIRAHLFWGRIAEVPITLHPDGRKAHAPHLKTFRDGWRTLRLYLLFSPRWLFLIPGLALMLGGLIAGVLGLLMVEIVPGVTVSSHTALVGSLAIICGFQALVFSIFTKTLAIASGWLPQDELYQRLYRLLTLERGLLLALAGLGGGLALLFRALYQWWRVDFGPLDYAQTMRYLIPASTFIALSVQTIFSSFFVSVLSVVSKSSDAKKLAESQTRANELARALDYVPVQK